MNYMPYAERCMGYLRRAPIQLLSVYFLNIRVSQLTKRIQDLQKDGGNRWRLQSKETVHCAVHLPINIRGPYFLFELSVMVLSKSSVELGTTPQLIHGMDLESFQFTLELYTSSASEIGLENETVGCISGGKLVFIPCHNTSSGKQIVVHMGIGGTN